MTFLQNIMIGAGTIVDIFPKTEPRSRRFSSISRTDSEAIRHDFEMVGRDIMKVALDVSKEKIKK
ncbi:hypothetical protein ACUUL3_16845 [Thiovibrio sp. JS02]